MFGINFNVTAKDVGIYAGVPLAIGGAALVSRFAYDRFFCGRSVSVKSLATAVAFTGGLGGAVAATSGMINSYVTKQPLGKEVVTAVGHSVGTIWFLLSIAPGDGRR